MGASPDSPPFCNVEIPSPSSTFASPEAFNFVTLRFGRDYSYMNLLLAVWKKRIGRDKLVRTAIEGSQNIPQ